MESLTAQNAHEDPAIKALVGRAAATANFLAVSG